MWIQFVQEGRVYPQHKMWFLIIEIAIGLGAYIIMFWLTLKLIEQKKMKKIIRRYKEENDPGKKLTPESQVGPGFRTSSPNKQGNNRVPVKRKPILQDAIVDAKRKLLQSGTSGADDTNIKSDSDNELNHRY